MKTWVWLLLLVIVAALFFALGRYWSTIKTAVKNRDKIGAGLDLIGNIQTLTG